jgi:predicted metalloprotease
MRLRKVRRSQNIQDRLHMGAPGDSAEARGMAHEVAHHLENEAGQMARCDTCGIDRL